LKTEIKTGLFLLFCIFFYTQGAKRQYYARYNSNGDMLYEYAYDYNDYDDYDYFDYEFDEGDFKTKPPLPENQGSTLKALAKGGLIGCVAGSACAYLDRKHWILVWLLCWQARSLLAEAVSHKEEKQTTRQSARLADWLAYLFFKLNRRW